MESSPLCVYDRGLIVSFEDCKSRLTVDVPLSCPGRCEASSVGWEKLCDDVRPLVLGNLSLHELACAAGTCREFWRAYQSRLSVERVRLKSMAEETFGKERLEGFVKDFQRLMLKPCRGLYPSLTTILAISESGQPHILTIEEAKEAPIGDGRVTHIRKRPNSPCQLFAVLWGKLPGSGKVARITLDVQDWGYGVGLIASVSRGAGLAAVGLILAIVTSNSGAVTRGWRSRLTTTVLKFRGSWGVVGSRKAEDIVGPLRPLATSFKSKHDGPLCHPHIPSGRRRSRSAHPLGDLQIRWYPLPRRRIMVPGSTG
jgi:hypothetical protein